MDHRNTILRLDEELENQLNTDPRPSIAKKLIVSFLETCRDYAKNVKDPNDLKLILTYFRAREALYRMEFGLFPEVMLESIGNLPSSRQKTIRRKKMDERTYVVHYRSTSYKEFTVAKYTIRPVSSSGIVHSRPVRLSRSVESTPKYNIDSSRIKARVKRGGSYFLLSKEKDELPYQPLGGISVNIKDECFEEVYTDK